MGQSVVQLAQQLLAADDDRIEEVLIHAFEDDDAAHDDELIDRLVSDFNREFDRTQAELVTQFGAPIRTGESDDDSVPLNGVFRFAVWDIEGRELYAAAAHEDRGVPILLMVGTESGGNR